MRKLAAAAVVALALTLTAAAAPTQRRAAMTGTQVSLLAHANNRFVVDEQIGTQPTIANRLVASTWERWTIEDLGAGLVALRGTDGRYLCAEAAGTKPLIANRTEALSWETFRLIANTDGSVSLLATVNNRYVTAEAAGSQPLIANRTAIGPWERFTPATRGGQAEPLLPVPPKRVDLVQATADNGQLDIHIIGDSEMAGGNFDGWSGCDGRGDNFHDGPRQYLAGLLVDGAGLPAMYQGPYANGCHGNIWSSAVGGRTIDDALAGYLSWLNPYPHADLVIVELGTNDLIRGDSPETALGQMTDLVGRILNWDARTNVLVVNVPVVTNQGQAVIDKDRAYNAALPGRLVGFGDRVGLVDVGDTLDPAVGGTCDGGMHWNDHANQVVAGRIVAAEAMRRWYGTHP